MRHRSLLAPLTFGALLFFAAAVAEAESFDDLFHDRTMRVDLYHTGSATEEIFAVDQVVSDGPWAGSRTRLLDDLNLGQYHFTVYDVATNRLIYSRGFSNIFGEWETTAEARTRHRTFHESLRLPWPRKIVKIVVEKRDVENHFRPLWSVVVDPSSRFVNPAPPPVLGEVIVLHESGPPQTKVDLLFLGDGFAASERDAFIAAARRMTELLLHTEPFARRRNDFNVRAVFSPASDSGVSRPRADEFHRTPLGVRYNIFDSERYALTLDNRAMRDIAAAAPYEFVEILLNEEQYGGGGIYNDHATASVNAGFADYLMVHEFAHHFADLADEYYTSAVAYETGGTTHPEPWRPNVTALLDGTRLKWGDLVDEGTLLPTPWEKYEFEQTMRTFQAQRGELRRQRVPEETMDELFREVQDWSTPFLARQEHSGQVGAFEGAQYEPTGLYRPELDCIMFTRDEVGFCRVCQRGIEAVIDLYAD